MTYHTLKILQSPPVEVEETDSPYFLFCHETGIFCFSYAYLNI